MLLSALPPDLAFRVLAQAGCVGRACVAGTCTAGRALVRQFNEARPECMLKAQRGSLELAMFVFARIDAATWRTRRKVAEALNVHRNRLGVRFDLAHGLKITSFPRVRDEMGLTANWTMRPNIVRLCMGGVEFTAQPGGGGRGGTTTWDVCLEVTPHRVDRALAACRAFLTHRPDSRLRLYDVSVVGYWYPGATAGAEAAAEDDARARLVASGLFVSL